MPWALWLLGFPARALESSREITPRAREFSHPRPWLLMRGEAEDLEEESFRKAIDVARRQQAKSWELRAATSLSRLLQKQGRRDEARRMLGEIYHWFTEGFDTADLKDAKALLDSLA